MKYTKKIFIRALNNENIFVKIKTFISKYKLKTNQFRLFSKEIKKIYDRYYSIDQLYLDEQYAKYLSKVFNEIEYIPENNNINKLHEVNFDPIQLHDRNNSLIDMTNYLYDKVDEFLPKMQTNFTYMISQFYNDAYEGKYINPFIIIISYCFKGKNNHSKLRLINKRCKEIFDSIYKEYFRISIEEKVKEVKEVKLKYVSVKVKKKHHKNNSDDEDFYSKFMVSSYKYYDKIPNENEELEELPDHIQLNKIEELQKCYKKFINNDLKELISEKEMSKLYDYIEEIISNNNKLMWQLHHIKNNKATNELKIKMLGDIIKDL